MIAKQQQVRIPIAPAVPSTVAGSVPFAGRWSFDDLGDAAVLFGTEKLSSILVCRRWIAIDSSRDSEGKSGIVSSASWLQPPLGAGLKRAPRIVRLQCLVNRDELNKSSFTGSLESG